MMKRYPHFNFEKALQKEGFNLIAGVDEAGKGAWAGPLCAAAVILDLKQNLKCLKEVRDSKLLTAKKREELFDLIREKSLGVGVGMVSHDEIDQLGIQTATLKAMRLSVQNLKLTPEYLLVDALEIETTRLPQKSVIKGDEQIFSIAAASIIAKVSRDREMRKFDQLYPHYGFAQHKGYGVKKHQEMLKRFGPCKIHRKSYRPIADLL
jgi:ribonuclease HII